MTGNLIIIEDIYYGDGLINARPNSIQTEARQIHYIKMLCQEAQLKHEYKYKYFQQELFKHADGKAKDSREEVKMYTRGMWTNMDVDLYLDN